MPFNYTLLEISTSQTICPACAGELMKTMSCMLHVRFNTSDFTESDLHIQFNFIELELRLGLGLGIPLGLVLVLLVISIIVNVGKSQIYVI